MRFTACEILFEVRCAPCCLDISLNIVLHSICYNLTFSDWVETIFTQAWLGHCRMFLNPWCSMYYGFRQSFQNNLLFLWDFNLQLVWKLISTETSLLGLVSFSLDCWIAMKSCIQIWSDRLLSKNFSMLNQLHFKMNFPREFAMCQKSNIKYTSGWNSSLVALLPFIQAKLILINQDYYLQ